MHLQGKGFDSNQRHFDTCFIQKHRLTGYIYSILQKHYGKCHIYLFIYIKVYSI